MNPVNNMTKYSLRSWVLVLALAPTILVGILLGSYFTINRFYELEDTLIEQGSNIIEPLAIASEVGLVGNDREATKRLLAAAQLNKSTLVKSIAIFDIQNQLFVTSHYHKDFEIMRYKEALTNLHKTEIEHVGDSLILRTPIFATAPPAPGAPVNFDIQTDNGELLGYISVIINKERALLEQHRAAVAAFIIVLIGVQLNLLFTFRLVKTSPSRLPKWCGWSPKFARVNSMPDSRVILSESWIYSNAVLTPWRARYRNITMRCSKISIRQLRICGKP